MSAVTINTGDLRKQEWIDQRDLLLAQAKALTACGNQEDVSAITAAQGSLGKHARVLHEDRMVLTRQMDALKKQCIAEEKSLIADLEAEKSRLQTMASEFVTEQRRRHEAARKEAEERARQEAAEAAEKADERAALAQELFGAKFDPSLAPDLPAVPVFTPPETIAGARVVTQWHVELIDPAKVPAGLMKFNQSAALKLVRAQAAQGKTPEISGLRVWSTNQVQSR